ncbi:MAG: hypothetical protein AB3N64_03570 [Puniceicoccaceae bacterium]
MKTACFKQLTWLALSSAMFLPASVSGVQFYTSDTEEPEPRQNELSFTYTSSEFEDDANLGQAAESVRVLDKDGGGVENFHYENDPYADWRFLMDGRWLVNPDELSLTIEAFKLEEIFFDLEFRHWVEFDFGGGVWYAPRNAYFTLSDSALEEEIDQLKVSLRFKPTDTLQLRVAYDFFNREGQSLSTVFGDNYQYRVSGQPKSRGIVPALSEGQETVHKVEIGIEHKEEINRAGARAFYQSRESDKKLTVERGASDARANRYATHQQETKDDLFGFSGYVRRAMTDNLSGSIGMAYTQLDGDVTGSRVFGANPDAAYDIDFARSQLDDRGFLDLDGSRKLKQWIFNGNLVYEPQGSYRWMAGVRLEHLSTEAMGSYFDTFDTVDFGDLQRQNQEADMFSVSDKTAEDISGFLEFRFKGIPKTLVYTRVEAATQSGDLKEGWTRTEILPNPGSLERLLDRATGFDRETTFWEVGLNYDPFRRMRISVEGYIKSRKNEYDFANVTIPDADFTLYPGYIEYQDFYTEDLNARVHWKILDTLRSVSRVDFQNTTIDSRDRLNDELRTSDRERVVFNQALTWAPHPRFIITGNYTLVDDLTEVPTADLEGTFSGIIVNIPNDYWQADVSLYFVLTSLIDIQVGYNYMEIDNYVDNAAITVPYGSEIEQHHGTASVFFHFTSNMAARIGYHYYEQTDLATAGMTDFSVHVFNGSLQMKF